MEGSKLKTRAICNPAFGGGGYEPRELRRELEGYHLEWTTTESPGDAAEAAKEWRDGLLIVAGGDGTINEVVNGLGKAGFPEGITLAILPAGTGNDPAATLTIPEDPEEAVPCCTRIGCGTSTQPGSVRRASASSSS
jgi:diacylglycerol kinase (ATP)